jgi:hypothetical protein
LDPAGDIHSRRSAPIEWMNAAGFGKWNQAEL